MKQSQRFVAAIGSIWILLFIISLAYFEAPEFRPWERLYDADSQRFAPTRQVTMRTIGDLGYKSWNRDLQAPRRTRFTTDRHGYRNPTESETAEIIVMGDSFVAGAGLSDEETVSMRLSAHLGAPVYNFAGESLNAPARFFRDERFARQRPKIVIWAPVARGIKARPLFFGEDEPGDSPSLRNRLDSATDWLRARVETMNRDNGLVREARFGLQGMLQRIRPNDHARTLSDGASILSLSLSEQNLLLTPEQRKIDHCIEMVAALAGILEGRGVKFIFSPIPESGTIYPELFDPAERRMLPDPSFLDRLIAGVRDRGIEVVDLRSVFSASRLPYLYLADDSHWNARATDLAAQAWSKRLRELDAASALAARASDP